MIVVAVARASRVPSNVVESSRGRYVVRQSRAQWVLDG
jgi:hypothetical protein